LSRVKTLDGPRVRVVSPVVKEKAYGLDTDKSFQRRRQTNPLCLGATSLSSYVYQFILYVLCFVFYIFCILCISLLFHLVTVCTE